MRPFTNTLMKSSGKLSIYLVDDDQLFITSLKDQLTKMFRFQPTVHVFSTGEDCLKNIEQAPNIVILDYFLNSNYPKAINGMEVLKKIKIASPDTKVIILSAQDGIEIAVNLIQFGAYDYIIKNNVLFSRLKMVVTNAANAISVARELKGYKLLGKIVLSFLALVLVACLITQFVCPACLKGD